MSSGRESGFNKGARVVVGFGHSPQIQAADGFGSPFAGHVVWSMHCNHNFTPQTPWCGAARVRAGADTTEGGERARALSYLAGGGGGGSAAEVRIAARAQVRATSLLPHAMHCAGARSVTTPPRPRSPRAPPRRTMPAITSFVTFVYSERSTTTFWETNCPHNKAVFSTVLTFTITFVILEEADINKGGVGQVNEQVKSDMHTSTIAYATELLMRGKLCP